MEDGGDREWRFGEVLSTLKERGCTVLIAGHAPGDTFDEVSSNFLGGRGTRRSRVFALLDRDVATVRRRLRRAGPGHEPALVVDTASDVSRAAVASRPDLCDRTLVVRPTDGSLASLESEVVDAIHDARQLHGPFEPAELRVCVDSLRTLAEHHDEDALAESVHAVADAIVDAGGMGHFVFPGDRDDPAVRSLLPAFDVLIELRDANDYVEQRWTFRDYDLPSLWMHL